MATVFTEPGKHSVGNNCYLNYIHPIFNETVLNNYLDHISNSLNWNESDTIGSGERSRQTLFWCTNANLTYNYGPTIHVPIKEMDPQINKLLGLFNTMNDTEHNSILVTKLNEDCYLPIHSDKETLIVPNTSIGCFVLGNARELYVKNKSTNEDFTIKLKNGCMYSMEGEKFQSSFEHSVPKTESSGIRYSITFRTLRDKMGNTNNELLKHTEKLASDLEEAKKLSSDLMEFTKKLSLNKDGDTLSSTDTQGIISHVVSLIKFISDNLVSKIQAVEIQCSEMIKSINCLHPTDKNSNVELKEMSTKIAKLEDQMECQEQYNRRLNLVVFGIKEKENENTDYLAADLGRAMGLKWAHPRIFQKTHRLGAVNRDRPRPIIMRFFSLKAKEHYLSTAYYMNKQKGFNYFNLKENLTRCRINILNDILSMKKDHSSLQNVYTRDGVIIVNLTSTSEPIFIRNYDQLLTLKEKLRSI